MGEGADQPQTSRRVTVQEATEILGVTVEAVRGRIKRGKLRSERDEAGGVYVWLDADQTSTSKNQSSTGTLPDTNRLADQSALVESLLEQVAYMREQLAEDREARRRADTIIAQLSQANAKQARTIRALEASQGARDEAQAPETAPEEPERVDPRTAAKVLGRPQSGGLGGVCGSGASRGVPLSGRLNYHLTPYAGGHLHL